MGFGAWGTRVLGFRPILTTRSVGGCSMLRDVPGILPRNCLRSRKRQARWSLKGDPEFKEDTNTLRVQST